MEKYLSRKFIISVAAFLASLGTGITGLACGNDKIAMIGAVCTVLSAALYAMAEALVDSASATQTTINASTTSAETVKKIAGVDNAN